jgi:hypothetical protein
MSSPFRHPLPTGRCHWVWCGLAALIDDYGTMVLINPLEYEHDEDDHQTAGIRLF